MNRNLYKAAWSEVRALVPAEGDSGQPSFMPAIGSQVYKYMQVWVHLMPPRSSMQHCLVFGAGIRSQ